MLHLSPATMILNENPVQALTLRILTLKINQRTKFGTLKKAHV